MPPTASDCFPLTTSSSDKIEIQQHRPAFVRHQNVGRLDVAVDDAAAVGVVQPGRNVRDERQHELNVPEPRRPVVLLGMRGSCATYPE